MIIYLRRGVAQPGSAPAWGAGGRQFKSGRPDQQSRNQCKDIIEGHRLRRPLFSPAECSLPLFATTLKARTLHSRLCSAAPSTPQLYHARCLGPSSPERRTGWHSTGDDILSPASPKFPLRQPRIVILEPTHAGMTVTDCVRMFHMEQGQEQPIHFDTNRAAMNLTLIMALVVVVLGFGLVGEPVWWFIVLGLGMAVYSWLTTPRRFLIYLNALVIAFGWPRVRVIPFTQISHPETLTTPIGERLQVRLENGRRVMLPTKNPSEFRDRLDEALDNFHGSQPKQEILGEESDTPY